jgi:hypothetical protein
VPRFAFIALAGLATLASGCAGLGHEGLAIEYHPGERPRTLQAPYDATYELFAIAEPGVPPTLINHAAIPQTYHVGFVRNLDGSLIGYAGGQKIPLPEGHYRWQMIPEAQRSNSQIVIDGTFNTVKVGGKVLVHLVGQYLSNRESDSSRVPGSKSARTSEESKSESKPRSEGGGASDRSDVHPSTSESHLERKDRDSQ